jgi:hypothetical protein
VVKLAVVGDAGDDDDEERGRRAKKWFGCWLGLLVFSADVSVSGLSGLWWWCLRRCSVVVGSSCRWVEALT